MPDPWVIESYLRQRRQQQEDRRPALQIPAPPPPPLPDPKDEDKPKRNVVIDYGSDEEDDDGWITFDA